MAHDALGSVVYSLTAADRAAYRMAVATERGPERRLQIPLGFVFIALGLLETATAIAAYVGVSVAGHPLRPVPAFAIFGPPNVAIGIAWVYIGRANIWFWFGRPALVDRRELRWDDAGVSFSGADEPTRTYPWSTIRRIAYVGGSVVVGRRFASDVVPARAFHDDGGDFTIFAEDRIVGKRLLVRAHPSAR